MSSPFHPRRLLGTLILCIFSALAMAQTAYSFAPDDTVLRKNYYDQSIKKRDLLVASIGKVNASDYKEIYGEQFDEITGIWKSTRPITSVEAHTYLQSIVAKIVAANPELKGTDARVVFSRDWWPNAASMGDGTVAINAGLVVFLDNEAELVFVICHELSHYYLEHTPKKIKKYVETINSPAYQAELKSISKMEYRAGSKLETFAKSIAFGSHRYSREFEAAADMQAYQFMKKTGYDVYAIQTTLELLDKVDDSSVYRPFDLSQLLNFPDYPFKKKWIQNETAIFAQVKTSSALTEKEKDSLKTHPDCSKRIIFLSDSLKAREGMGKKFLVNEKLFIKLRKDFFVEFTEECYREKKLSRNLYYSLQLLNAGESSNTAIYSIARCLNDIFENQRKHTVGLLVEPENRAYSDNYNLLLRMLNRVRLDEIANLCCAFCNHYAEQLKDYAGFREEMARAQKFKQQSL